MGLLDFIFNRNDNVTQMAPPNPTPNPTPNSTPDMHPADFAGSGMVVEDVFSIHGRGTVVTGKVRGEIRIGDMVKIEKLDGTTIETTITGIEAFRKTLDMASEGDNAGLLLRNIDRKQVERGDVIRKL